MFGNNKNYTLILRNHAEQVFKEYDPGDEYLRGKLIPLLSEIAAAIAAGKFKSVEDVKLFTTSLDVLPSFQRALLSAQILFSLSKVTAMREVLGNYLISLVASSGSSSARKSAQDICRSKDANQAYYIRVVLDVFWRHEESPWRELEKAQSTYLRGFLELTVFGDAGKFSHLLREALEILATMKPSLEDDKACEEFLAASKEKLTVEWQQDLERYG